MMQQFDRQLRPKQATVRLGCSMSTFWRLAKNDPLFPPLIKIGLRCTTVSALALDRYVMNTTGVKLGPISEIPEDEGYDPVGRVIDQEFLQEILDYDPVTGAVRWKISPRTGVPAGHPAGGICKSNKAHMIKIGLTRFLTHRLIWMLVHGRWPADQIDHIDRNPANNKLANLREATNSQNCYNRRKAENTTSKYRGVHFHKPLNKWCVRVKVNRKNKHIGYFVSEDEAAKAYDREVVKLAGEFALLNFPDEGSGACQ